MRKLRKAPSTPLGDSGWKVDRVQVSSTKLIELGPDWMGWRRESRALTDHAAPFKYQDAIVKVTAPADVQGSEVDALERELYERGARTVRVMPQLPADKVSIKDRDSKPEKAARSLRQVVLERAALIQRPRNVDALKLLIDQAMDAGEAACT